LRETIARAPALTFQQTPDRRNKHI